MVSGVKKTSRVSSGRPSVYFVTACACPIERTKSTWPVSVSTAPSPYGADSTKSAPPCSKFWCSSSARTSASLRVILSPGLRSAAELSEQPASRASTSPRASRSERGRDGMPVRVGSDSGRSAERHGLVPRRGGRARERLGGAATVQDPAASVRAVGGTVVLLPLDLAADEGLHQVTGLAVVVLHRRALHEVGRRGQDRAADAPVLGDLRGADG